MVFAGLTSVIAKAGLKNVSSDTGLAVRTIFVFVFVWLNIFLSNNEPNIVMFILPLVGFCIRLRQRSIVDLPAPEAPSNTENCPS